MESYYKVLDLPVNASPEQIKANYRKLILRYHPDVNSSSYAVEKFKEIVNAYKVLSTPMNGRHNPLIKRSKEQESSNKTEIVEAEKKKSRLLFLKRLSLKLKVRFSEKKEFKKGELFFAIDKELLKIPYNELVQKFRASENKYVRAEALKALCVQYKRQAFKQIMNGLDDISKEVKEVAIKSIGYISIRQGIDKLEKIYDTSSRTTKRVIIRSVSQIPSKKSVNLILKACFEDDSDLRLEGLKAISKQKLFFLAPKIKSLAYDTNIEIQSLAKELIYKTKKY